MSEVIYRTVKLPLQDEQLFDFLADSVQELDMADSVEDIPRRFICRLSELLGYGGQMLEEWGNLKSSELIDFCA